MQKAPTLRASVIYQRTYSRPFDDDRFETFEETIDRVIEHQTWLWKRALGGNGLKTEQFKELDDLRHILLEKKASVAGRTLWLGGTETSKKREATMFNCSALNIKHVTDIVDAFHLLLQGCGVGFAPLPGTLNGFFKGDPKR